MKTPRFLVAAVALLFLSAQSHASSLVDKILQSDFVFDRNLSNIPFLPLGYVQVFDQNSLRIRDACTLDLECEYRYRQYNQGLVLPVWVSQKNMFLLGETLTADHLQSDGNKITVNTGGLLAAWVAQPNQQWQAGAFVYTYDNIGNEAFHIGSQGYYAGVMARYRQRPTFHTYWGLVSNQEEDLDLYLPYFGFDWILNQHWSISGVLPWPGVSYAPTQNTLFRAGVLAGGVDWSRGEDGSVNKFSLGKFDFGLSFEHRIYGMFWGELTLGRSGLGRFTLSSSGETSFDSDVESDLFIRIGLNFRPSDSK